MIDMKNTKIEKAEAHDEADYVGGVVRIPGMEYAGRYPASTWSAKDGGYIAILCTPIRIGGFTILDIDDKQAFINDGIVGKSNTPRGAHYYLLAPPIGELTLQVRDPVYEKLAQQRGFYGERLFNVDGSPRELPEIFAPNETMHAHRDAFLKSQFHILKLNKNTPQEEQYPGEEIKKPSVFGLTDPLDGERFLNQFQSTNPKNQ